MSRGQVVRITVPPHGVGTPGNDALDMKLISKLYGRYTVRPQRVA